MTDTERASLRRLLLLALELSGELGMPENRLLADARAEGFVGLTAPQLELQLRAMADGRHVTPYDPQLGAKRWRITALGHSALVEAGLA